MSIVYFAIILIFPLITTGGWMFILLMPSVVLAALILGIFVTSKYRQHPIETKKWLLVLLSFYMAACLSMVDGGDGRAYVGFETLLRHLTSSSIILVSEKMHELFFIISLILMAIFFILNIVFLIKFRKSIKNNLNSNVTY